MNKKLMAIVSAILIVTAFFSACGQKPAPQTSSQTETTAEENITENETAKETTNVSESTVNRPTETEILTHPVSDPTKPSTTDTEVFINFLYEPEKIVFYSDGKAQTLTKEVCDDVIEEINKVTRHGYWDILKLAVFNEDIDKIKEQNCCIEIHYDGSQILNDLNGQSVKNSTYRFEKVLIVLDGNDKNTMFLEKNGEYQSGPLYPLLSNLSEEILKEILDE